ncbi:polysaccharide pyruvyl transferase family protein [Mucilaginibacter pedocola]|uniref:Polysaccharide pyruvyl transferase domain-containing protein n=1 Tax=Mucilaginibacter pedocola TaxID=1792845 RepID=A0A1S9P812_9SPHI|nr:polysaccharide pyruvyl transferase family protein [Mucilaginibacter pedocola]OOQ57091.1 hypothetical protein BC343_16315 [Mucilaginibacter pedocola]
METRNEIFFQGNTQYENTGDILINKSLVILLRQYGTIVVNNITMPEWYVQSLLLSPDECITNKQKSFYSYFMAEAFSAFFKRNKKIFLIAGPPGHLFGNSRDKSIRNLTSAVAFVLFRLLGVKIIKIGFSMGPLGKRLAFTEQFRSPLIKHYLVRDSLSLKLAKEIGIKHANFFPDLAWTLEVAKPATPPVKNKIVVSFRDSIVQGASSDEYLNKLKENLFGLLKTLDETYSIEIVYQVTRDRIFCKRIYDELKNDIKLTFNETQVTLDNAAEAYSSAVAIITNRLHGALLAYKYGALPLVLTDAKDHLKIKGIYLDAGVSNLLLNVHDDLEHNTSVFKSLLANKDEIIAKMNKTESEYIALSHNILSGIFKK